MALQEVSKAYLFYLFKDMNVKRITVMSKDKNKVDLRF